MWEGGEVAKLKVLCARALQQAVMSLAADFRGETGDELDLAFGAVGGLQARLDGGEAADVLILSAELIARLEQRGALVAGSRADIASTCVGVAVREGAAIPDIANADAFRRTLLAAGTVAFTDASVGGTAAVYLPLLFDRMGIADAIAQRAVRLRSGGEVAQWVARGDAEIGMTMISEIVAVPGARVLGPLPEPLGKDMTYTAAVSAGCQPRAAALAFIQALRQPASEAIWARAGLDMAKNG
jgi:molybdate transport system substrate-binding protein